MDPTLIIAAALLFAGAVATTGAAAVVLIPLWRTRRFAQLGMRHDGRAWVTTVNGIVIRIEPRGDPPLQMTIVARRNTRVKPYGGPQERFEDIGWIEVSDDAIRVTASRESVTTKLTRAGLEALAARVIALDAIPPEAAPDENSAARLALQSHDVNVVATAAAFLADRGNTAAEAILVSCLRELATESGAPGWSRIMTLLDAPGEPKRRVMRAFLALEEGSPSLRERILACLVARATEAGLAGDLLQDPDPEFAASVAIVLLDHGDASAEPLLVEALLQLGASPWPVHREHVVDVLQASWDPDGHSLVARPRWVGASEARARVLQTCLPVLRESQWPEVRAAARGAMATAEGPEAIPWLLGAVGQARPSVVIRACELLERFAPVGHPETRAALLEKLAGRLDPDEVSDAVAHALGRIGVAADVVALHALESERRAQTNDVRRARLTAIIAAIKARVGVDGGGEVSLVEGGIGAVSVAGEAGEVSLAERRREP